ncbi:UNVERIFIED_CONTAM: hypothetical protein Slati_2696900 [Sesamum latifolium]|uniref:Transposase n=1 Tax=Sesamum latifolium TaxID=2727402 RepID=A0AAW2VXJ0_9LAMI
MSRNAFGRLCHILQNQGRVKNTKQVSISEQVAIFLSVLAHHKKNRIVKYDFIRSTRTGCLGALEDTYIGVHIPAEDRTRHRTRKGLVSVNVLGMCDRDMRFIYVLSRWEGTAADSRVLRDVISRPTGLKIPRGNYYLVDNGYSNRERFLSLYRGVCYHLKK